MQGSGAGFSAEVLRRVSGLLYGAARPLLFRVSAQRAHDELLTLLQLLDARPRIVAGLAALRERTIEAQPIEAGGVRLAQPLILAAGLVKGRGFSDERTAMEAVERRAAIMPGWRSMPALVGAVELGSFTRWPRLGNPGVVIWRDSATRSTQNRVGLKNPGARAAAAFLSRHRADLPPVFGINIAVSPGVRDPIHEQDDVITSMQLFRDSGIVPSWWTLNLSCPNTEDDPAGHQTEQRARKLCSAIVKSIGAESPLWIKVGPDLSRLQYAALARALAEAGARAVIATNTLAQPAPDGSGAAGMAGGRLHASALTAAAALAAERARHNLSLDIIGCGGVLDGNSYRDFTALGIDVVQYFSALVYRGPLAAAQILDEARDLIRQPAWRGSPA